MPPLLHPCRLLSSPLRNHYSEVLNAIPAKHLLCNTPACLKPENHENQKSLIFRLLSPTAGISLYYTVGTTTTTTTTKHPKHPTSYSVCFQMDGQSKCFQEISTLYLVKWSFNRLSFLVCILHTQYIYIVL